MSLRETVKNAQKDEQNNPSNPADSFGIAIELGDMTQQGVKAADNLCASFYRAFNDRMEKNLKAIRSSVAQKSILVAAEQKALPPSEGSFMDSFWQLPPSTIEVYQDEQ